MSNYIIDKNITINGNVTINDSLIYITSLDEYNKYKIENSLISICNLIPDNTYAGDLTIEGNLIICCYEGSPQFINCGEWIAMNTITL
tara:strand:+ start:3292 stop:3555 length:264 start_codon:yes stop_codon:yes gene_type:complete